MLGFRIALEPTMGQGDTFPLPQDKPQLDQWGSSDLRLSLLLDPSSSPLPGLPCPWDHPASLPPAPRKAPLLEQTWPAQGRLTSVCVPQIIQLTKPYSHLMHLKQKTKYEEVMCAWKPAPDTYQGPTVN